MKWYIPSWNGDVRLVPDPEDPQRTLMIIEKPTPDEQMAVDLVGRAFLIKKWVTGWEPLPMPEDPQVESRWEFRINAPVAEAGAVAVSILRPGAATLTAFKMEGGEILTTDTSSTDHIKEALEKASSKRKGRTPEAAATVRRPTPCCPQCVAGSVGPATEVLLTFLDEEQHRSWARERAIVVEGGLSGNHYLIAHRHSPIAARIGRICFDTDDRQVVHFHDLTVPPEEEVLAAALILKHREPWLRNEATMFDAPDGVMRFKNPFGDISDGAGDANFMRGMGIGMMAAFGR